jgi:ATP-dependent Clp protease ATP-binding subunit ClpA
MTPVFDLNAASSVKLYNKYRLVNAPWWKLADKLAYIVFASWFVCAVIPDFSHSLLAILSIVTAIGLLWLWLSRYWRYLSNNAPAKTDNLADSLDRECIEYFLEAQRLAGSKKVKIDAAILWLTLNNIEAGKYFLIRAGFTSVDDYTTKLTEFWQKNQDSAETWSPELLETISRLNDQNEQISLTALLENLVEVFKLWQDILTTKKLDVKDAQSIFRWYGKYQQLSAHSPFWQTETVEGGVGRDWSFGYTPHLLNYGRDLTLASASLKNLEIHGHSNEVLRLEQALTKSSSSNALLVGDHGVGRKTIVYALSQKIVHGQVAPVLWHKHIWEIDTGRILAAAGAKGEVEARLKDVFDEAVSAGDIILFIDDIHALLGHKEKTGTVNASEIIMPYLRRSDVQIIGTTTIEQYHSDIEANTGLAQSFEKIDVVEPPKDEVIYVLEDVIPFFEARHNVIFTFPAVKEAVNVTDRYIHDKPFPVKAIELIDNVATTAGSEKIKIITPAVIDKVASIKTEVPVGEASKTEKDRLLHLDEILHQRVVGQNEAVSAVASALKRARSGLNREHKPIGTFLFVGPTGVGKTETAKALAEAYFGSEDKMIRLDMSEYQTPDAIAKLIGGAPQGDDGGSQGELTKAVKDSPFTVVLLDEIEKANPSILNLFLQVLDDGRLTDGTGRTVDFSNAIIIATSNAGAEIIRQAIKKNTPYEELKKNLLEYLQSNNIFKPEFLNRFDGVIAYRSLTFDELLKIIDLMTVKINDSLKTKNITVTITVPAKQKIAQLGYDPVYGARPLWRVMQTKIEDPLADRLLRDEIKSGTVVNVDADDIN